MQCTASLAAAVVAAGHRSDLHGNVDWGNPAVVPVARSVMRRVRQRDTVPGGSPRVAGPPTALGGRYADVPGQFDIFGHPVDDDPIHHVHMSGANPSRTGDLRGSRRWPTSDQGAAATTNRPFCVIP
jgi:hypothetical protein